MTIREIYEITKDDPLESLMAVSGIARIAWQNEPSTFDGDCGTALAILNNSKTASLEKSVEWFVNSLGPAADVEISDGLIKLWLKAVDEEL